MDSWSLVGVPAPLQAVMAVLVVDRPVRNVRHVRYFVSASNSGFPRSGAKAGSTRSQPGRTIVFSVSFVASLISTMARSGSPAIVYTRPMM